MPRLTPAGSRPEAPVLKGLSEWTGASHGPGAFGGEIVVLAFWSSWCSPCRAELGQLETAWRAHPAGTQVLGIDVDDSPSPASSVLRHAGVTFPNVADPDSSVAGAYRIAGTPTIVILDRRGRVAATAIGPTPAATILRLVRLLGTAG